MDRQYYVIRGPAVLHCLWRSAGKLSTMPGSAARRCSARLSRFSMIENDRTTPGLAFHVAPQLIYQFGLPVVYGPPALPNNFLHDYLYGLWHPTPDYYVSMTASMLGPFWKFDDYIVPLTVRCTTPRVPSHKQFRSSESQLF